jgi:hypothetical protein
LPTAYDRRAPGRSIARYSLRDELNPGHQLCIANEVGDAIVGQARLARAQQFAGTAQLEVALRDDEAVVGVAQHGQARLRSCAQRRLVDEHTVALRGPAADPAAQLMQLR